MFQSARFTLTAWYLLIIMTISVLFSLFIYNNVNAQYREFEHMQRRFVEKLQQGYPVRIPPGTSPEMFDPEVIPKARTRLVTTLGIVNLVIFAISGAAGYFLAGRTLRPIKQMVDEQHRFIADASHELRTPLTSLRSEIEVSLRDKHMGLADAKKLLVSNLEEVVSLQLLSDNLLELASGRQNNSLQMKDVNIKETIEIAMKKLDRLAKRKRITVTTDITDTSVVGIKDRLIELFVILLDNAIKYSPEKSTIKIVTKRQNNKIAIHFIDEGVGIAKEDLPFVFDRFYRASKSRTKEKVSGYGLGLSIAKKIVALHKGTISVKSTLDKGTTFIIHLPLAKS